MRNPTKILLVDDDPDDRYLFSEAISGLNGLYDVTCVNNFTGALSYLATHKPALIFLDLNMPIKNGFDCLSVLKKEERYKKIPVVIFSSSSYEKDIQAAYDRGAALYFTKPSGFDILSKALNEILLKNWDHAAIVTASHFADNKYKSFAVHF
jgi:CheY-like chemotaxis protein